MTAIPAGAFERAWDWASYEWEGYFPGHCYICHIANEDENGDTIKCGPHCEVNSDSQDNGRPK